MQKKTKKMMRSIFNIDKFLVIWLLFRNLSTHSPMSGDQSNLKLARIFVRRIRLKKVFHHFLEMVYFGPFLIFVL